MQKHPLHTFSPDANSAFNSSKLIKFLIMTYTVLRGMINFIILCSIGVALSFFISWLLNISDSTFLLVAIVTICLVFSLAYSLTKKNRFLRVVPLKCSNCHGFMETKEYDDSIFYECPKCMLYVDSGIRNEDQSEIAQAFIVLPTPSLEISLLQSKQLKK